ncbi:villin-1-like [Cloeon dipterum]|uniref:villin-1-like n=1 Tax=Cloeon dipterum TaxID=197152 RepID=UPI0032202765
MSGNNAGNVDPAFASIPRNSTGLHIWRIENLKVVALPRDQYGQFSEGDSYIVYAASEYGKPATADMKPSPVKGNPEIHLHFWLGLETSQDEAGVAAYKTVELDDLLGGGPVQHREIQGQESSRFQAYFPKGMRLMKGGVSSGFKKVTDTFTPRLYRVKGRRSPVMTEMAAISWKHFNSGDCFIIDTKDIVFVWTGKKANNMEKLSAAKMAQQLKTEHEATGVVFIEEGQELALPDVERKILSLYLDPKAARSEIAEATEDANDAAVETAARQQLRLYHCSDESGTLKVTEVKTGPLSQSDLSSTDSYIVDNGANGIWVWVGKRASPKERVEAMRNAHGFVKKKGYPSHTAVTRVIDGGEPVDFKQLFVSWRNKDQTSPAMLNQRPNSANRIARTVSTVFDATTLHERPQMAAETQLVDDASGDVQLWRVRKFGLENVEDKHEGIFFSGDCYLLKYTYLNGTKEQYILYYWLGLESSQDEQGTAALKAVEKDMELGGSAVQVRVTQGKEPPHFLSLFAGKFIIINGGYASSFDESEGQKTREWVVPEEYMLQVYGNSKINTRATQVPFRAASLNTNDVFVVKHKGGVYVWCGKGSTGDEREMGKGIASKVGGEDNTFVSEGQEKEDFWKVLGGKEPYADSKRLSDAADPMPARLFQCSNATGTFRAEEIVNFAQTDLIPEDVMLLDANECIFVWVGSESRKDEQKAAVELALEYLRTDPSGRGQGTPLLQLKQGFEPPNFTGFFGAWNPNLWSENKSFEQMRADLVSQNGVIKLDVSSVNGGRSTFKDYPKYPLSVLSEKDPEKLPEDVDPTNKEMHLSNEEFSTLFGMDFAAFEALPQWRRANLKKQAGIF